MSAVKKPIPIDLEELKAFHERFFGSPSTSHGQREDSGTILRLIQVIEIQDAGLEEMSHEDWIMKSLNIEECEESFCEPARAARRKAAAMLKGE